MGEWICSFNFMLKGDLNNTRGRERYVGDENRGHWISRNGGRNNSKVTFDTSNWRMRERKKVTSSLESFTIGATKRERSPVRVKSTAICDRRMNTAFLHSTDGRLCVWVCLSYFMCVWVWRKLMSLESSLFLSWGWRFDATDQRERRGGGTDAPDLNWIEKKLERRKPESPGKKRRGGRECMFFPSFLLSFPSFSSSSSTHSSNIDNFNRHTEGQFYFCPIFWWKDVASSLPPVEWRDGMLLTSGWFFGWFFGWFVPHMENLHLFFLPSLFPFLLSISILLTCSQCRAERKPFLLSLALFILSLRLGITTEMGTTLASGHSYVCRYETTI